MIGAHYYPWFGKPAHSILGGGEWKSGYADQPVLGEYSSRDHKIINQHVLWAKDAGIDFFIMNWIGADTWDDITLKDFYLSAPLAQEIKFCFHYDSYQALNKLGGDISYDFDDKYLVSKTKGEKFLEDFEYLADTYFRHPQYVRIDGRPLVIIYVVRSFKNAWRYFEQLSTNMKKRGLNLFLVADIVYVNKIKIRKLNFSSLWKSPQKIASLYKRIIGLKNLLDWDILSRYFKGITGYNLYQITIINNFLKEAEKEYQIFWREAQRHNLHFIPTIIPGYDDRNLSGLTRPILERKEGYFYRDFLRMAKGYIDQSLKMAFITSFNEWHEGTEIEPSKEYGTAYLELTKLFATELKNKGA